MSTIYLSTHLLIHLFIYLLIYLSTYLFIYLYIDDYIYKPIERSSSKSFIGTLLLLYHLIKSSIILGVGEVCNSKNQGSSGIVSITGVIFIGLPKTIIHDLFRKLRYGREYRLLDEIVAWLPWYSSMVTRTLIKVLDLKDLRFMRGVRLRVWW